MNHPTYRPPAPSQWTPARTQLGQAAEMKFMNMSDSDVSDFLTMQGVTLGYAVLASIVYGKYAALDRILLGLGAIAFGASSYYGFKLGLDWMPSKHPADYVAGTISGALNAVIALGAAAAAVNPRLIAISPSQAVKAALPG